MGFFDDIVKAIDKVESAVDGAASKLDAAASKVESVSDGVQNRVEQIAEAPGRALKAAEAESPQADEAA
ncbi:MAG TPA: hypothetical protein VLF40_01085 [Candidatus Saccharimonadales bacterium]|nr:hypothetical protein [Candidatus Saccharimonadales bacterium]